MAIKDLLDKIRNIKPSSNGSLLFDPNIIQFMDGITLNEKYDALNSYTQTHFCQTGTNNKLDINDRPYDHDLWVEHDELLKLIAIEMLNRPLYEKLRESKQ